jgi:hypothetical protein
MAGNDELFKALSMFQSGVKDLQTSRVITQANEAVAQVKATEANEQKQRAQLQTISNQLVAQMAGMGVPATTMATVAGAIGPKQFANGDQAILEGQMTGSNWLTEMGKKANTAAKADDIMMRNNEFAHQDKMAAYNRDTQLMLAGLKGEKGSKSQGHITDTQINAITQALATEKGFADLVGQVDKDPGVIFGLTGPIDAAASMLGRGNSWDKEYGRFQMKSKQLFNAYRSAVTGAGASEKEIKMLEESFPTGKETADIYKEKVAAVLEMGRNVLNSRLSVLEASGKDTSKLKALIGAGPTGQSAGAPPGMSLVTVNGPNGPVKAYKDANGNYFAAE